VEVGVRVGVGVREGDPEGEAAGDAGTLFVGVRVRVGVTVREGEGEGEGETVVPQLGPQVNPVPDTVKVVRKLPRTLLLPDTTM